MTTLHPSPYLPSLREFRAGLRAHLTRLLTPDAAQAHAHLEGGAHIGKIVLTV